MSFLLDTDICSAHMRRPARLAHRFIHGKREVGPAVPAGAGLIFDRGARGRTSLRHARICPLDGFAIPALVEGALPIGGGSRRRASVRPGPGSHAPASCVVRTTW